MSRALLLRVGTEVGNLCKCVLRDRGVTCGRDGGRTEEYIGKMCDLEPLFLVPAG